MNLALLIAACAVSGLLVVLLVAWALYARWLRVGGGSLLGPNGQVDLTNEHGEIDPAKQIRHLKLSTQEFGIKYAELKFGKMLGKGSQGEVFKANWRGSTVAVKKVDTRKVPPEIIEEFCQEAQIMRRLRHPSLTLFMGVSLEHPHLCIVTEIVARGSLFDIIHDEHAALTWPKCLGIALDVAKGMTYLHAHNPPILHRDLKSLNILVDENWRGKVADFGMTRFQEDGTMTQCGSPLWMAPEMIRCLSLSTGVLLPSGDVATCKELLDAWRSRQGDDEPLYLVGPDGARAPVKSITTAPARNWVKLSYEGGSYECTAEHSVTLRWGMTIATSWHAGEHYDCLRVSYSDAHNPGVIVSVDFLLPKSSSAELPSQAIGCDATHVLPKEFAADIPLARQFVTFWLLKMEQRGSVRVLRAGDLFEVMAKELPLRMQDPAFRQCVSVPLYTKLGPDDVAGQSIGNDGVPLAPSGFDPLPAASSFASDPLASCDEFADDDDPPSCADDHAFFAEILQEFMDSTSTNHRVASKEMLSAFSSKSRTHASRRIEHVELLVTDSKPCVSIELACEDKRFVLGDKVITHNCDPYDEKSDVYSFAICLWEMYTRKIPYRELGLNPSHLVVKVVKEHLRPPIPKQCPRAFKNLMEKCWAPLAEKRPTFPQILATLEKLVVDPAILNHKPNSSRDSTVVVRPGGVEGDGAPAPAGGEGAGGTPLGASVGMASAERGWKIDAKELHFYNAAAPAFLELLEPAGAGGQGAAAGSGVRNQRTASKANLLSDLHANGGAGGGGGSKLHLLTDAETLDAAGAPARSQTPSSPLSHGQTEPPAKDRKTKKQGSDKKLVKKGASSSALGRAAGTAASSTTHSPSLGSQGAASSPATAVTPAPLVLNTNVKSTKEAKEEEAAAVAGNGYTVGPNGQLASQGPGVLLAKYRNRLVAVKTCFIDSSHLHMSAEERVIADLDGKGVRDSKLANFMREVAGLRHPNIVLFQGAYLEPLEQLKIKLKESGQSLAGSGLDDAPSSAAAASAAAAAAAGASTSVPPVAAQSSIARPPPGCEYYVGCVNEFMSRGTLHDILCDPTLVVDWATMIQLLLDAASGMCYLAGHKPSPVVHQDFSSKRLLVDRNWRVRVGDYAFVDLHATLSGQPPQPTAWSAPEYIKNPTLATLSLAANVFSFGMLMWQAVVRRPVWDGRALTKELADKIVKQGDRPPLPQSSFASKDLKNLIEKCWMAQPHARPSFPQILAELARLQKLGPPKVELILGVNAHRYRKAKTVFAYRSKDPVTVLKDWGTNVGKRNCLVLFSGEDDVYLCDEDVFMATYEPLDPNEPDQSHILEGLSSLASAVAPPVGAGLASPSAAVAAAVGTAVMAEVAPAGVAGVGVSASAVPAHTQTPGSPSAVGPQLPSPSSTAGAQKVDLLSRHREWRKTGTVLARCMEEAFSVRTEGGSEHGMAGDYLVANESGDQWSIEARTFLELYERCD